jgi:predicted ribosome quality control (RQC) complex YloA/Tae2 family protein
MNEKRMNMALDGLVVRALVHELQACVGSRINKIHQPTEHDMVLYIRANRENKRLLLSANPTYPRVHWTEDQYPNPTEPPMFCMLFRKHFEGAVIESITQPGFERVIHIDVRHFDELGDATTKRIIIEIMGRHSNILLIDPTTNQLYDGIHHVTPSISSYRVIMPGSAYTEPPVQEKQNLLDISAHAWEGFLNEDAELPLAKRILETLSGISPQVAESLAIGGLEAFLHLQQAMRTHTYSPYHAHTEHGKVIFGAHQFATGTGAVRPFPSMHACLDAYYTDKAERDAVKQRASDLIRFVSNEKAKNEKKMVKLAASLQDSEQADQYRLQGELLTTYMHQLKKGDTYADVVNYYDENQATIRIPLDPLRTPSENAQACYKKYTKLKNGVAIIQEQMAQTKVEIAYLAQVLQQVESAGLADVMGIREELEEQGYLRRRAQGNKKAKKPEKPMPTHYLSSEGISIYVGKNNLQNDYVTHKLAHANDTWLHVKDMPGSHVVIRSGAFGEKTLEEAALLAAYFSSGKQSSLVPVDYTLVRHVKKPSGSKPGFVIYEQQKTIFITPEAEKIAGIVLAK